MAFIHGDVNAPRIEGLWGKGFFFAALSLGPRIVLGSEWVLG